MRCRVVPLILLFSFLVVPASAGAQSAPRFEAGAQFTAMRLAGVDITDSGVGGWAGWNVTDVVALEAVGDLFPGGKGDVTRGGRKFQALAGPRVGWRVGRLGLFGRARAGVARVGEGRSEGGCIAVFPPPEGCYSADTRFVVDLGGGIDVRSTERTTIRFDVGSLWMRLNDSSVRYSSNHDFPNDRHFSAGMGWRF
jgi:hypothetical protein